MIGELGQLALCFALALSLGAADYFTKPVDWQRLHRVLSGLSGQAPGTALVLMEADETRTLLAAELGRDGWRIGEAETEEEAFHRLAAAIPTVILLDPFMAGLDGFAFLKALSRNPDWSRIPVIVVAAQEIGRHETEELRGRVQDIIPMAEDGADGVIEELKEAIARLRPASPERGMGIGATNGTGGTDG